MPMCRWYSVCIATVVAYCMQGRSSALLRTRQTAPSLCPGAHAQVPAARPCLQSWAQPARAGWHAPGARGCSGGTGRGQHLGAQLRLQLVAGQLDDVPELLLAVLGVRRLGVQPQGRVVRPALHMQLRVLAALRLAAPSTNGPGILSQLRPAQQLAATAGRARGCIAACSGPCVGHLFSCTRGGRASKRLPE